MAEEFSLYGNPLRPADAQKAADWQLMFKRKFRYDENEPYDLSLVDNEYLGPIFGLKNIVRDGGGDSIRSDSGVVLGTVRMGFGHYRIAMAGASAARSMGFTPLWLDLLSIPGITSDVINWWNTRYSRFSRLSQRSRFFNQKVWEAVTTGNDTIPGLSWALNNYAAGWPWRFLKANARDYRMSELFGPMHHALPADIPIAHSPHVELHGRGSRRNDQRRRHDVRQLADGLPAN